MWLGAAALLTLVGTALLPTPAVPFARADAAIKAGPDAGQAQAEDLAIRTVLRVTNPIDGPALPGAGSRRRTMTT